MNRKYDGLEIAIIGMAGQFPDSENFRTYWKNIAAGKELLTRFTKEELLQRGGNSAELEHPDFVQADGIAAGKENFDHAFFDYSPDEAALMDPQIRLLHENCWKALEDAGYAASAEKLKIGLFAGASDNENWRAYMYAVSNDYAVDPLFKTNISRPGFMCTLVSHKLNLRGPSVFVDTACSTSLTSVHLACRSLLTKECTLALAGGVTINTSKSKGYMYEEGGVKTKDGHSRAFDEAASGTAGGEGIGMVVLKRLSEAIRDRDHIYAILRSTSINNDGSNKVGYTAPSVKGQSDCIKMAHKLAGIEPATIGYIETHGTATRLGDVVEMSALNEAFNKNLPLNSCAIGSVKTNIGHLDRAAGVASLVKVAMSISHRQIAPSLFFSMPNPEINFDNGPFYVNTALTEWKPQGDAPLRAGISSFGIGGSNAHVIVEEAPVAEPVDAGRDYQLLTLSARTKNALLRYADELKTYLEEEPELHAADIAYTLQVGRKPFEYRKTIEYKDREDLAQLLRSGKLKEHITKTVGRNAAVVFMFSGLGAQYTGMCKGLYDSEPVFKAEMDKCFAAIREIGGPDIKAILYPDNTAQTDALLPYRIDIGQYLVFIIEYALAKTLIAWGLKPYAMIGYSFGEYLAACIAGVFSVEDAIKIIHRRGELIRNLPGGVLFSVPLPANETLAYLNEGISLAIDNGDSCVVSGNEAAIQVLEATMKEKRLMCMRLSSSHALHSHMMAPILDAFEAAFSTLQLHTPEIPYLSNVTGDWIKVSDATDPKYWGKHLRHTVQFAKGIQKLLEKDRLIFLEIGPGNEISTLVNRELEARGVEHRCLNIVPPAGSKTPDEKYFINRLGKLWAQGAAIDWNSYHAHEKRNRVSLPAYSFEPNKYVAEINPFDTLSHALAGSSGQGGKKESIQDWFYQLAWKQSAYLPGKQTAGQAGDILVFADNAGVTEALKQHLSALKGKQVFVTAAEQFAIHHNDSYSVNPYVEADFVQLCAALAAAGIQPERVIHCWSFSTAAMGNVAESAAFHHTMGFESLLHIVRSLYNAFPETALQVDVIGKDWYNIVGTEILNPASAAVLGAVKVIPKELQHINCRAIEIPDNSAASIAALWKELGYTFSHEEVAIRGNKRYIKDYEKIDFSIAEANTQMKTNGTYLITGASGGMGNTFAAYLAETYQANLVLVARTEAEPEFIRSLIAKGAQVMYIKADIADKEKMEMGIAEAEAQFGTINGIIHAAGIGDFGGIILRRRKEEDDLILRPKTIGTEVLHHIFQQKNLDFFVHCSSLAATVGPIGHVAYTAANIYQDTVAQNGHPAYPVISIGWTNMRDTGMNMRAVSHLSMAEQEAVFAFSIKPAEAIQALEVALYLGIPTPLISTTDIVELVNSSHLAPAENITTEDMRFESVLKKERPDLSTNYTEPVTDTERQLVTIFENYFGIEGIGTEDDFFELGGDSLRAMVLLRRVGKELGVDINLKEFLANRHIQGMASIIEEKAWINTESDKKYSSVI
jgi:phthiocerol/phenolphthiocerol synthesis type-I polyketide synthase E